MNLQTISDKKLLQATEEIAQRERANTVALLYHLKEIDRRRLFADLRYSSLFDYTVKHLKYSEDQAFRRIAAARLLAEVPEIARSIESGQLTLTNVTIAENMFRRQKKSGRALSADDKRQFLNGLAGKSSREAEKAAMAVSPSASILAGTTIQISMELDSKIKELKALMAHTHPGVETAQLLEVLCDLQINKLKKDSPAAPRANKVSAKTSVAAIRRQVWQRDKACCVNCGSKYAVQVDHIQPKALGGADTLDNLRLLCRKCNQRAAIQVYGSKKMEDYLRPQGEVYRFS